MFFASLLLQRRMFESLLEIEKLEDVAGVDILMVDFFLALNVFMPLIGLMSLRELRDVNLGSFCISD